jgi:AraC family transcriptional regulator
MELKLKAGQFYGNTAQALVTAGFCFTEKLYSSSAKLPVHAHELSHFCFVLSGGYREKIGTGLFAREPSALVFYPPDVSHSEEHLADGRHFLVEIDLTGLERVTEYGACLNEPVALGDNASAWLAARMYKEFRERDKFSGLALESISTELLIAASRRHLQTFERKPPRWLKKVKECLHESFSTPPSLNELAGVVGVHPTHLTRVFRQFEACTVGDYIRRIRIEQARRKILTSNDSLVEIALDAGFADQTHFTRSFRRVTGMTPTEFRSIFKPR